MKQYVLLLAALSLTGCAYGEYKTSYLQEYASYDCDALKTEQVLASLELDGLREKYRRFRSGFAGPAPGRSNTQGVYPSWGQESRMRNHARQQAVLQLTDSQGCRDSRVAGNL